MKKNISKKLKRVAQSVAFAALFVGLTGCGSDGSAQTSTDGKIQIEYWHVNAETQGGESVEKLVTAFNEQSEDITVVSRYNPDMYKGLLQNLQAEVASGNAPAMIQVGWSYLEYFNENFGYTSPVEIIEDYFPEDANFLEENFLENILELAQNEEGEQMGLPYSLSTPVLYLNTEILAEYGLDPAGPSTWEEVVEYATAIKEESGKYGIYIQEPADNWATQAILESNGAQMITDGEASFASEEGIEAYQIYADMVLDGVALHISWDEGLKSFVDGEVAMAFTTIARSKSILDSASFEVTAVAAPSWEGVEKKIPAGGAFLAITAQEEETQKAAWEFQKFLYENESVEEWSLGTGYVPSTKAFEGEAINSILEVNPMMAAAVEQMENVVPWASFPGDSGLAAEQLLIDLRDQILGGSISAKDGLSTTQDKINDMIK